jgi:hypothetical protein
VLSLHGDHELWRFPAAGALQLSPFTCAFSFLFGEAVTDLHNIKDSSKLVVGPTIRGPRFRATVMFPESYHTACVRSHIQARSGRCAGQALEDNSCIPKRRRLRIERVLRDSKVRSLKHLAFLRGGFFILGYNTDNMRKMVGWAQCPTVFFFRKAAMLIWYKEFSDLDNQRSKALFPLRP